MPKNRGRKKFPPGFFGRLLKFSNNFGAENLRFFLVLLCRDPFCDASAARSFALAGSICGCPLCFHHRLCVIGPFCCRILAAARVFCLRRLLERIFPICRFPFYQSNCTQSFCSRPRLYFRERIGSTKTPRSARLPEERRCVVGLSYKATTIYAGGDKNL